VHSKRLGSLSAWCWLKQRCLLALSREEARRRTGRGISDKIEDALLGDEGLTSSCSGVVLMNDDVTVNKDYRQSAYDSYVDKRSIYDYDWYHAKQIHKGRRDEEIKQDIESEMWWSPVVSSDAIDVSVENGVAILRGTVKTWRAYDVARENAIEGGAASVDKRLKVE